MNDFNRYTLGIPGKSYTISHELFSELKTGDIIGIDDKCDYIFKINKPRYYKAEKYKIIRFNKDCTISLLKYPEIKPIDISIRINNE